MRSVSSETTQKEREEMAFEKEMFDKQAEFKLKSKQLEVEVLKIDAKFSGWLKLPSTILMLPLKIMLVVPMIVYAVRKQAPPKEYWDLLTK